MGDFWNIFASQEPAGIGVNLLILFLFAFALSDVMKALRGLQREEQVIRDAADRVLTLVPAPRAEGEENTGQGLALGPPSAVLKTLGVPQDSLLGIRLERILQLRKAGLGYRDVLQKLSVERVEGLGSHSRFIATILTLLGLVGTVVGMSLAMLRISGAFQSTGGAADAEQLTHLTEALNGTLEGMKTAFGCTLAGLSGAVLLASANHFMRRRQTHVATLLEGFLITDLLPVLEKVDPEEENSSRSVATVLANAAERIDKLASTMVTAGNSFEDAGKSIGNAVGRLDDASNKFATAATSITETESKLTSTMEGTKTSVDSLAKTMDAELKRIHASTAQMAADFEKRLATIEAVQANMRSYTESFEKFVEKTSSHHKESVSLMLVEVQKQFQEGMGRLIGEHSTKLQGFSDLMLEAMLQRTGGREETNGKSARHGGKS